MCADLAINGFIPCNRHCTSCPGTFACFFPKDNKSESLPKYFEKHFFQVTVIILLVQEINGKSVFFRQIEIVLKVVLEAFRISNSNIFKCRCSMSQLLSLLPEIPRLLGMFPQKRQRK